MMATISQEPSKTSMHATRRFEYKVIDTGKRIEEQLNKLGAEGWQVVGVTTKKQFFIAPPQAIIIMREAQPAVVEASSKMTAGPRGWWVRGKQRRRTTANPASRPTSREPHR